jgi:hypothetical protein
MKSLAGLALGAVGFVLDRLISIFETPLPPKPVEKVFPHEGVPEEFLDRLLKEAKDLDPQ